MGEVPREPLRTVPRIRGDMIPFLLIRIGSTVPDIFDAFFSSLHLIYVFYFFFPY
jgi:hypothetical protein